MPNTMTLSKEEQIEAALALGHSLSVHREYARRGEGVIFFLPP